MSTRRTAFLMLICLLVALVSATGLAAQSDYIQSQIDSIQQTVNKLEQNQDGEDSTKKKQRLSTYKKALSAYQTAAEFKKKTRELAAKAQNAKPKSAKYQAQRKQIAGKNREQISVGSAADLAGQANALRDQLKTYKSELSDARGKLATLTQLPQKARANLKELRAKKRQQEEALTAPSTGNGEQKKAGQQTLAEARRARTMAHIAYLKKSLATLGARKQLVNTRQSLLEERVSVTNQKLAIVNKRLSVERQESAQALRKRAETRLDSFKNGDSILAQTAQQNVEMAASLVDRANQTDGLAKRRARERSRLESLQRRLNLVHQQLSIGAGSAALGQLLRQQRRQLPKRSMVGSPDGPFGQIGDLASVQLNNFQLSQQIHDLKNLDQRAHQLTQKAGAKLDANQHRSLVRELKLRREIAERLQSETGRYVEIGKDLRQLASQFDETLTNFHQLLNERLFWLPSSKPLDLAWGGRLAAAVPKFLAPSKWAGVLASVWRGLSTYPFLTGLGIIVLAGLAFVCRLLPARLASLAKPVGRVGDDTIWLTLRAGLMTLLLTVPVPLALLGVWALIIYGGQPDAFAQAVGTGVFQVAMLVVYLNFFIQISRDNGLADAHFKWPLEARRTLNRSLLILLGLLLVPSFLVAVVMYLDDDVFRGTLGRVAFIFSSLVIAGFAVRFFLPTRGVLSHVFAPDTPVWRGGYFWLPIAAVMPVALAVFASMGYLYTALQIQTRFFTSAALIGGGTVIYGIVLRWLTVVVRRLALQKARKRREEARQARMARDQGGGDTAADTGDEPEIDLPQIGAHTRGLIKLVVMLLLGAGLLFIWSNTLPALDVLNQITLWNNTSTINGHTQSVNITLGALLLALIVGVATFLAGRNLPGFLEISILQRLSMTSGSRYAVATLFKYFIFFVGLWVAVKLIGVSWSSIQWLVAALGVGLGFGLQAIFANFISGLIILFERPVRVGDIATVGTLTGVISRVRIRATTITDWDNKEVVIPNQTFITETVVNWTLSDDIARMVVSVRVAFKTDTDKVQRLIYEVIDAQPQVLDSPPPSVYMVGFDDHGLRFDGRVYYRDPYNNWMPLQHALYTAIHDAFAGQDVRITFEQRDLHLRSVDDSVAGWLAGGDNESSHATEVASESESEADVDSEASEASESRTERPTQTRRMTRERRPSGGDGGSGDGGGGDGGG